MLRNHNSWAKFLADNSRSLNALTQANSVSGGSADWYSSEWLKWNLCCQRGRLEPVDKISPVVTFWPPCKNSMPKNENETSFASECTHTHARTYADTHTQQVRQVPANTDIYFSKGGVKPGCLFFSKCFKNRCQYLSNAKPFARSQFCAFHCTVQ